MIDPVNRNFETFSPRTADVALDSEPGRTWLPWFREIFEQGRDVPPEHAARLVTLLASGRTDALSGRFFTVADNVLGLVERAERVGLGDSQTLRLIGP